MEKVRYIISDAAQMIDVESHVLRYWEEELDLDVPRNELGHRYYTKENIEQFQKIKDLKEKGYQLKAIKMLLHEEEPFSLEEEPKEAAQMKVHTPQKSKGQAAKAQTVEKAQPKEKLQTAKSIESVEEPQKTHVQKKSTAQIPIAQVTQITKQRAQASAAGPEEKMEQFQNLMTGIVKRAIEENNQALGLAVGEQVGEKVLKEMNYLAREQEELAEERYRRLDEAIRQHHKSRKIFHKKSKEKALQPKTI